MASLSSICDLLNCRVLYGIHAMDRTAHTCIASDRMSYVLASKAFGAVLVTHLTSIQAVRTAHITDLIAVVFLRGAIPDPKALDIGRESDLPLLSTSMSLRETQDLLGGAGLLYEPFSYSDI